MCTLYRLLVGQLLEDADLCGNESDEGPGYKPRRHVEVVQNRSCVSVGTSGVEPCFASVGGLSLCSCNFCCPSLV
jgi:hypothetical protein